jgi:hypothetical protein
MAMPIISHPGADWWKDNDARFPALTSFTGNIRHSVRACRRYLLTV